jgi:hypothetical protein
MSSARTALRERVAALAQAHRALSAGHLDEAERILQDELSRWPGNRDAQSLLAEVTRLGGEFPPDDGLAPARPDAGGIGGWSSFEARVRDRKVARLVERARAAIEAGAAAEALAAVEEIEAIAPGHPLAAELTAPLVRAAPTADAGDVRIDPLQPPAAVDTIVREDREDVEPPPARARGASRLGRVLVVSGLIGLAAWAGSAWLDRAPASLSTPALTASDAASRAEPPAASPGRTARPTGTAGDAGVTPPERAPIAPATTPPPPPALTPVDPPPTTRGAVAAASPAAVPDGTAMLPAPVESNEPDETPSDDASAMRGLIEGYLVGYNGLDAGGVQAVWPAVDRRALAPRVLTLRGARRG